MRQPTARIRQINFLRHFSWKSPKPFQQTFSNLLHAIIYSSYPLGNITEMEVTNIWVFHRPTHSIDSNLINPRVRLYIFIFCYDLLASYMVPGALVPQHDQYTLTWYDQGNNHLSVLVLIRKKGAAKISSASMPWYVLEKWSKMDW